MHQTLNDVEINDDLRNRILLFLYNTYYDGKFYDPQITDEVLQQLDISQNLIPIAHRNINYLEKAGYIQGQSVIGSRYPPWINILPQGIDLVESFNTHYADLHWKVRFGILSNLYEQYFASENAMVGVKSLVNSLAPIESNEVLIFGDVIYLRNKNIISGEFSFGFFYPPWVSIDVLGIQIVEQIMNQSLVQIANSAVDSQTKKEAEEILRELDKKSKLEKFNQFLGRNSNIIELVINIAKSFLTG